MKRQKTTGTEIPEPDINLDELCRQGEELLGLQTTEDINLDENARFLIQRVQQENFTGQPISEKLAELARTEKQALRHMWQCAANWYWEEFNFALLQSKFEDELSQACLNGFAKFMEKTGQGDKAKKLMISGNVRPDPSILLDQPELKDELAALWEHVGLLMSEFVLYHHDFADDLMQHASTPELALN